MPGQKGGDALAGGPAAEASRRPLSARAAAARARFEPLRLRHLGLRVPGAPVVDVGINAYFRAFSGRPYQPYQQFASSVLAFPPSSQGRRVLLEPRGSRRREAEKVLDLRIEKIFKVGGRKDRFSIYADVTNALNASTVDGLQYRVPSLAIGDADVAFDAPTSIVDPRQVTFGARWSF